MSTTLYKINIARDCNMFKQSEMFKDSAKSTWKYNTIIECGLLMHYWFFIKICKHWFSYNAVRVLYIGTDIQFTVHNEETFWRSASFEHLMIYYKVVTHMNLTYYSHVTQTSTQYFSKVLCIFLTFYQLYHTSCSG